MRFQDLALRLIGSSSGEQILRSAATASGAITLPAGVTDFSSTGGASQVVKQTTAGGPFTVAQLAAADISGALTGNQTITLSGDISGSGATAITTTLPTVNANVGSFQGITVNAKGLVTAAANQGYTTNVGTLTGVTAGTGLTGGGTSGNPTVALATPVSVANGGTGLASGNSGGVLYYSAAGTIASSAALTANAVVKGGGAGAAPVASGVTIDALNNLAVSGGVIYAATGVATGDATIALGYNRTGSGNALIDLHADAGTDFDLRLLRNSGANGNAYLQNAGTGTLTLLANTGSATLNSSGNVTFSGNYLYQNGGTGTVSTTGGPLIYADLNNTVFKLGSGNVSFLFQSYAGTNAASISGAGALTVSGNLTTTGTFTRPGIAGPAGGNVYNINHGTGQQLWIDNVNMGTIAYTSDYRIKDNIEPLSSQWDRVKALRPVSYIIKGAEELLIQAEDEPREHWGFVAHELQEDLIEAAATGYKDAPNLVQSPDPWVMLAAVTKALQEAMARIEALEGREPAA